MIIIINSNSTKNDRKTTDARQRRGVGPSRYRLDLFTWRPIKVDLLITWRPIKDDLLITWRPIKDDLLITWRPIKVDLLITWRHIKDDLLIYVASYQI